MQEGKCSTSKRWSSRAGERWPKLELNAKAQTKTRTATSRPKILAKMSNGVSEGNAAAMGTEKGGLQLNDLGSAKSTVVSRL